jgi:hypothetical protein
VRFWPAGKFNGQQLPGLKLSLHKNSADAWNISGLTQFAGKKSASEIFIKLLLLERPAVSVNARVITGITMSLNDFSTKD